MHPDAVPGFRQVIGHARLRDPVLLSDRAMQRMMRPVEWILSAVGEEGVQLTKSGYLPPWLVEQAMADLKWDGFEHKRRENQIIPLMELRMHMRKIGLLRVRDGVLLRTKRGTQLTGAPRQLWHHVALTFHESRNQTVSDATKILLLMVASRILDEHTDYGQAIALGLSTLGWLRENLEPVTSDVAWMLVADRWRMLHRFGVFGRGSGLCSAEVSAGGAAFARTALQ